MRFAFEEPETCPVQFGGGSTFRTATDWIDPETVQVLRTDSFFRQRGKGSGKVSRYRSEQLVAFERQPR